jgi:hypothetical protein
MQDVPIGRAFRCPHFLHWVSGSSVHISTFSPHFWQRISSGLGVRISALPGQPSLNMRPVYSVWKNNSMIHVILGGILSFYADNRVRRINNDLEVLCHRTRTGKSQYHYKCLRKCFFMTLPPSPTPTTRFTKMQLFYDTTLMSGLHSKSYWSFISNVISRSPSRKRRRMAVMVYSMILLLIKECNPYVIRSLYRRIAAAKE